MPALAEPVAPILVLDGFFNRLLEAKRSRNLLSRRFLCALRDLCGEFSRSDPDGRLHIEKTLEDPDMYVRPWTKSEVLRKQTNWDDLAFAWEIEEQHLVCEGGSYPSDNNPY